MKRALLFLLVAASRVVADPGCDADMDYDNARMRDARPAPWSAPAGERVVLENEHARVSIWPEAGGAVTEYLHKPTGTNFVAGEVSPGTSRYGWKDITQLSPQDAIKDWLGSRPHEFRRVETAGGPGIELGCRFGDLESRRVLVLDPASGKLSVTIRLRNIGKTPRRLFPRWHPYTMVGDPYGESSMIFVPDARENLRQIKVGIGWDNSFIEPRGYAAAVNWKTGEGLWLTYDPARVPLLTTWTDYAFNRRHPMRGAFTLEPWMTPVLGKPGEAVEITYVYTPFTRETPSSALPLDELPADSHAPARRFAQRVLPNAAQLAAHTMVPKADAAAAVKENRFHYSHRRRDRMALREWGFADALFSAPGVQSLGVRARLFAERFPGGEQPVELRYRFFVETPEGSPVLEKVETLRLAPGAPATDLRRDWELGEVADGTYLVGIEIFEKEERIHRVVEKRRLVGQRVAKLEQAPPEPTPERAFVKALREAPFRAEKAGALAIPIGVEEGGGVARSSWPVYAGVPFGKGMVRPDAPLRLRDAKGRDVPFQRRVSGLWEDGSARWLLLDFAADLPADGIAFFTLENGEPEPATAALLLRETGEGGIDADTGTARWSWREGGLLGPVDPAGLWWSAADGTRYEFQLRGEGAGLEIEQNGPQRAVVRARGWYYAEGQEKPIARGTLRFLLDKGQAALRLEHNVLFAGDAWRQQLGSYGIIFPLPGGVVGPVQTVVDGKVLALDKPFTLLQSEADHCVINGKPSGQRAEGIFRIVGEGGRSRTLMQRNFWRLAPKEVKLGPVSGGEGLAFFAWPESPGGMSFLPREDGWLPSSSSAEAVATGMSRTLEYVITDAPVADPVAFARQVDEPVLALVPPRYLAQTGAMRHLTPADPQKYPALEQAFSQAWDTVLLGQELWGWYGHWTYGSLPNLWRPQERRWADFGRYAYILNELDLVQTPWLAWMRTGDRRYHRFAEAATRQLMEVSTIQWSDLWPEWQGLSRRHHECVWLSSGDYGHSMLDPFLEMYRMTGHTPAWEATLAMADAMARQTSPDQGWRYLSNPLAGLARMSLETQEPRYREQADRIWNDLCAPDRNTWWKYDHGDRALIYYSQLNPEADALWKEWALKVPERAVGMDIMTALFLRTGEGPYAEAVRAQFRKGLAERKKNATDPLRKGLGPLTQYDFVWLRWLCYSGAVLEGLGTE